ncbi:MULTISPECIES: DUF1990 family protein [unclassified Streptomyces]|uniref:DUF1990 family protein n=1 Tax=unclassified Streptomyces TaxID=2593676 RepID=UPI002255A676|nr:MULTISPECIES: DUF1990 domain-containing protein [unclassified Streptomyces]MCX5104252.1 DUF1990 domain-containing protein [Streptomyces sp. NBC_00439]WSC26162.1 DUF1990 domain-containing protein [Streptomyces sp. NBC_01768]WSP45050.1 DUF1990 domain-containing protein [Streptomyces sp. NBC_01243]
MSSLSYSEVGATRLGPLPTGYHHLHHRALVGRGRADLEAAGAAVTEWRMHRASGARVHASAPRAGDGVRLRVSLGIGPIRFAAPCQVVWTAYEQDRIGFAYGTEVRHPERGEECFVVELADDGTVWFTVMAFSRPAAWYTRLAGPVVPVLQRLYARRLGSTLRRIVDGERGGRG